MLYRPSTLELLRCSKQQMIPQALVQSMDQRLEVMHLEEEDRGEYNPNDSQDEKAIVDELPENMNPAEHEVN